MIKDEVLKAFYLSQIAALAEQADTDTLDLIYRLLLNENNTTSQARL